MPSAVRMRTLLETGVHFGHRTNKWNPKMDEFIFTQRNGIHIIDLQITLKNLNNFHDMIANIVADGGSVLFVGTKRQAQEIVQREAGRCSMPYVNHRWLGGTLTNWKTIRSRIDTLKQLEQRRDAGEFDRLTKKEGLVLERKIAKLQLRLGGIREMQRLPEMLIIVDTVREATAVKEANILKVPVVALVDTNSNPDEVDYIIPANDDAVRSITLLVRAIADAVLEGQAMRKADDEDEDAAVLPDYVSIEYDGDGEDAADEQFLGEATLAKLRDANLFEAPASAATDAPPVAPATPDTPETPAAAAEAAPAETAEKDESQS
jgi:small subunit ribosomal protein S2